MHKVSQLEPNEVIQFCGIWHIIKKYFVEILTEALIIGCEAGILTGNGKTAPIGLYNKINEFTTNGEASEKDLNTNVTNFSPSGLAPVKAYLTKDGTRKVDKMVLVCNPLDEANNVAPALYDQIGNMVSSFKNLEVVATSANPRGKALFMLPNKYTFGFDKYSVSKFDQTMALDDADVMIGKVNGNGMPNDDNVAYVFDVTKLEEFVYKTRNVEVVAGA